jgi:hypothetical protein
MYGFKKPKFAEFPIKRAQIDFWFIGFAGVFAVRPRSTPNYLAILLSVAWTIEFEHMFGFF